MSYEIDESTGLPKLPKGYFWRVVDSGEEYVRVQVRKKTLLSSKVKGWCPVRKKDASKSTILSAARYAMREMARDTDWRSYIGDYPPKKLEEMR